MRNTITSAKPPTRRQQWKKAFAGVIIIALCGSLGQAANATDSTRYVFNIPAQQVEQALSQLAEHTGHQLLFSSELVNAHHSNAVSGEHTVSGALQQLLQSTPLTGNLTERGVIIVSDPSAQNQSLKGRGKMETTTKKKLLASMVGLFAAGGVATATAQDSMGESARAQGVLDEIIITATKRETKLQDTPASIAAIGSQEIDRRGLVGMEDYLATVPGVSFLDQGVGKNNFVIRGVASDPEGEAWRSGASVGVYFGEVPMAGLGVLGGSANPRLVDIERVEVLRGPQGTLFGAGSLAGALRYIPVAPNLEELEGKVRVGYSNTAENGGDNYKVEGVVNIPLIEDKLAIRAVAYRHDNSGFIKNVRASDAAFSSALTAAGISGFSDKDNIGDVEYSGGRLAALWRPIEELSITLQYLQEEADQVGHPEAQLTTGGYTQARAPFGNLNFFSPIQQKSFSSGADESLNVDLEITNLVLEYDFETVSVLSSSAWIEQDSFMGRDLTSLFTTPVIQIAPRSVESFVHETRLVSSFDGPLQLIAGVYYEDRDTEQFTFIPWAGDISLSPFGTPFSPTNPLFSDESDVEDFKQSAYFAELSYDISDQLKLTVGGRRFDYDRESHAIATGAFGETLATGGEITKTDETGTNYKVNLGYQADDESLIYVQWAEGFRPGNVVNPPASNLCDLDDDGILDGTNVEISNSFDADTLETYELGVKSTVLESRLQINASIYRSNWEGLPISVQSPTCLLSQVSNAGEARTQGLEIETLFNITSGLQLILGGSYVDAELTEDAPTLGGSKGDRLPGSPDYSVNIGLDYDFDISGKPAYIRGDYAYISGFHNDLAETSVEAGDYGRIDLKTGISLDNISLELFANNLTNEDAIVWPGTFVITARVNRLTPRTIGFNVGYQF